jgi:hypothetical protein
MDDVSSLMASAKAEGDRAPVDTPENRKMIRKKGKMWVIVGDFSDGKEYDNEFEALAHVAAEKGMQGQNLQKQQGQPSPLHDDGPTMTSGDSSMDAGDEKSSLMNQHQPSSKAPGAESTGQTKDAQPQKPDWMLKAEKEQGIEYEYDPATKRWLPKKGKGMLDKATAPVAAMKTPGE